jgi:DMSO reductase anchor subunit
VSHGHGPPPEERIRRREARVLDGRDITPAVGRRGGPGTWKRASPGARVRGFRERFADARWSFLYDDAASRYEAESADGQVPAAARVMRGGSEVPVPVRGPVIRPNVWTWEVPVYFFFGGMAAGASFVALACEVAGDERSARIARFTAMGAAGCGGPLLIADLGRPERFHHMFRIFKTRSPMSMGAWCLLAFTQAGGGAVAADLLGRRRVARALTAATAACGVYLGSYTGVLLAGTAVPAWNRSRAFLPPIFVCTATATGAAATRLVLAATGVPAGHPTRRALTSLETLAMSSELVLSGVNERRLGRIAAALEEGTPGRLFKLAKRGVQAGLALRLLRRRPGPWVDDVASGVFLLAGLAFRFAWVGAGRTSARDHEAVAMTARTKQRGP